MQEVSGNFWTEAKNAFLLSTQCFIPLDCAVEREISTVNSILCITEEVNIVMDQKYNDHNFARSLNVFANLYEY